jgi:hypothetical protein
MLNAFAAGEIKGGFLFAVVRQLPCVESDPEPQCDADGSALVEGAYIKARYVNLKGVVTNSGIVGFSSDRLGGVVIAGHESLPVLPLSGTSMILG